MITPFSFESCLAKQKELKKLFSPLSAPEQKYQRIIEMGRSLPPYPSIYKQPENLVSGCQSIMHLYACLSERGTVIFIADSEALISRGLAALLIAIYNDERPEVILACPPSCFEEIGIQANLSPSRSQGLGSLYFKMKQEAVKFLKPAVSSLC